MLHRLLSFLGTQRARATGTVLAACLPLIAAPGMAETTAQLTPVHVIVLPLEVAAAAYYAEDLGLFKKPGSTSRSIRS